MIVEYPRREHVFDSWSMYFHKVRKLPFYALYPLDIVFHQTDKVGGSTACRSALFLIFYFYAMPTVRTTVEH